MEEKKSFILYLDYKQHLNLLTDEECGQLFRALFDYTECGDIPYLSGKVQMAFSFIRAQLDRDAERWDKTRKVRSEAGQKGGIASGIKRQQNQATEAIASNALINEAYVNNSKQEKANQAVNVNVNDNVNVNVNGINIANAGGDVHGKSRRNIESDKACQLTGFKMSDSDDFRELQNKSSACNE